MSAQMLYLQMIFKILTKNSDLHMFCRKTKTLVKNQLIKYKKKVYKEFSCGDDVKV